MAADAADAAMELAALPYRPCVGLMVVNRDGLVWAGYRVATSFQDAEGHDRWWQMPQGGVDPHEDLDRAALRELEEETGIVNVSTLARSRGWHTYEFPPEYMRRQRGGTVYRGQRQKWFAVRFLGEDREIDIGAKPGALPEFTDWRWLPMGDLPKLVAPFKRKAYTDVVAEFAHWGALVGNGPAAEASLQR